MKVQDARCGRAARCCVAHAVLRKMGGEMRVLVAEDEARLAENLSQALSEGGPYAVDVARDGEQAVLFGSSQVYDGIVLDLMLPLRSGSEVLRALRARGVRTPVLVLTAVSERANVIDLLNLGADDYMSKPFDLGELLARLRAVIRRSKGVAQPALRFGAMELQIAEKEVRVHETPLDLSPTEYRILEYMLYRPRVVVSPQEMLEHLFDFTWKAHSNVVEVHISNLRKKLRAAGAGATLENLRGRGYRLSLQA